MTTARVRANVGLAKTWLSYDKVRLEEGIAVKRRSDKRCDGWGNSKVRLGSVIVRSDLCGLFTISLVQFKGAVVRRTVVSHAISTFG